MAKYTVEVDKKKCISCATCTGVCPNNFKIGPDGKSMVLHKEISDKELTGCKSAAECCSGNAIRITDAGSGKKLI
jgi:ferredoxin